MEPLYKQLRELPRRLGGLSTGTKIASILALGIVAALALAFGWFGGPDGAFQYAFTNLSPEDSTEAAAALKSSGVPYRLDAGGGALAVPASKVYEVRLLLAAQGLPRGGGVGFELFDRGDLGVSEFTQRVNLRRALEGELARTISRLAQVRSARVHLSLGEKGLYRDEDKKPSASVVLNLRSATAPAEKEIAGIRHLVAASVPGLSPDGVTIVDARGAVLAAESDPGEQATSYQRRLERDLEARVASLLEAAVGAGAVVARVNALVDSAEVTSNAEVVDPDATALRSERKVSQQQGQDQTSGGGAAGAVANQPLQSPGSATSAGVRSSASTNDEVRNFDVSKTTTTTITRSPRLKRLSVAVLVDGVDAKPRGAEELRRLEELAKRAVGFDLARGDQIDVTSAVFTRAEAKDEKAEAPLPPSSKLVWYAGGGAALLVLLGLVAFVALRGKGREPANAMPLLRSGARVSELERALAASQGLPLPPALGSSAASSDPALLVRERARELAAADPQKAAHLIRAWIGSDAESEVTGG